MNHTILDRLCGRSKDCEEDRKARDADAEASRIQRAIMKANAAIREARIRRKTDTAFMKVKPDGGISSGMYDGALGLTNEELGLLPKGLLEQVLAEAKRG